MSNSNAFSLNFPLLKSQAKKRLKAIRDGDKKALRALQLHHPKGEKLTLSSIQLADVQLVIAREHHLKTWPELKRHAESLMQQHHAMLTRHAALDADMTTLHVRCGHDIQATLVKAGFEGDFLPFIEPFCLGPLHHDKQVMAQTRARYICEHLLSIMGQSEVTPDTIIQDNQRKRAQLADPKYKRIVFWAEHDNYDQLMLISLFAEHLLLPEQTVELIEIDHFPGKSKFIGLGQLPAEAIRLLWQSRQTVTSAHLTQAALLWRAFKDDQPHALLNLHGTASTPCFSHSDKVIHRHLQELPHYTTGLGFTQHQSLNHIASHPDGVTVKALFSHFQHHIDPLPFLGDVMFWSMIKPMTSGTTPLLALETANDHWLTQTLQITEQGKRCLAGEIAPEQHYWVGGIDVTPQSPWRWDHQDLASLRR
ncbi:DUF1835 domain-containing protein [Thaumasiovibrio subtropicus]|uniref:DUF1835 domain-containing protein n=1 Tax=Thaumasiovibrio subtropicus TaxID=1891207 RepID=UPI000B35FFE9|nr:DUF1835 domain-containing protein [Thaumasiovibrio subtropicus]